MSGINTDYSQFYKGTQQINAYGSGSGQKDTVVRYQFNTTDEEGNKVMDKMSKEDSFRTMNGIRAQYGDNVIVEFSGDGLTAFEEHKGKIPLAQEPVREIPEDMITYLDGPVPLTEEELAAMQSTHHGRSGDEILAKMQATDPDAYKEYEALREKSIKNGFDLYGENEVKFMARWVMKNEFPQLDIWNKNNKKDTDVNIDDDKDIRDFTEELSKRFPDADIFIGDKDTFGLLGGDKFFKLFLTKEEAEILKNGSDEEKDKLLKMIDDSLNDLQKMREKYVDKYPDEGFRFGISIGNDGRLSFLAQDVSDVFSAASTEELLQIIDNKRQEA